MSKLNFNIYESIIKIQRDRLINTFKAKYKDHNIDDEIVDIVDNILEKNLNFTFQKGKVEIDMENSSKCMKLIDYLKMQLDESNLEMYITIQNMELLKYIAKCDRRWTRQR